MPGSQRGQGIDHGEKHRSPTRKHPATARIPRHGREGISYPLDVTLEDDLENEFTMQSFNTRVDRMAES